MHCWKECKMVLPLWKIHEFLKTLKTELPCDSEMSLLGIYSKKLKPRSWRHLHRPMFTAVLFMRAKRWKQSKCRSMNEGIKKCHMYIQWNIIHPQKGRKFWHLLYMDEPWGHCAKWNKPNTYDFTCEKPRIVQFIKTASRRVVASGGRRGESGVIV